MEPANYEKAFRVDPNFRHGAPSSNNKLTLKAKNVIQLHLSDRSQKPAKKVNYQMHIKTDFLLKRISTIKQGNKTINSRQILNQTYIMAERGENILLETRQSISDENLDITKELDTRTSEPGEYARKD